MKNKSKLKKIREKKAGTATVTKEWLYMNPNSITVAEIEAALEGMDGIETEIWKEAGVLEVEVPEHHSMDIEEIAVNLKDEYANALFAVTIDTENYAFMQKIMQKIIAGAGGFFCGDTEDFTPVVKQQEVK